MRSISVLVRRAWQVPLARKVLLAETVLRTASAWVLIRLTPYKFWGSRLGLPVPVPEEQASIRAGRASWTRLMDDVAWSHHVVSRVFGTTFTCLMLALSARGLLSSRGASGVLVLGVRLREGGPSSVRAMGAHAWVVSGGAVLVGEMEMAGHTPVAAYVRRKRGAH